MRYLRAGIAVNPYRASPARLRTALETVLRTPAFHARAAALAECFRAYRAPETAAALLEALARTKAPVLRTGVSPPESAPARAG